MLGRARLAAERLRARVRGEVFSIGIYAGPSPLELAPLPGAVNPVLTCDDVTDVLATFVADPFMVQVDGTWHMFFEVMSWRPGCRKGEIALATSRDGVKWTYQRIVLAESFHLSYPYVFESGSEYYMVPESCGAGAIRLYRADPFPDRWIHVADLVRGPVLRDSSVFQREGRWWMFSETGQGGRFDTLRLFHSPSLTGPWAEHSKSPVVVGNRSIARPAGRVVSTPEGLLRFAQDCRSVYGASVRAVELRGITPSTYEEVEIEGNPILSGSGQGWNRLGMHHLDAHHRVEGDWIACVDGWTVQVRKPREVMRWMADRLR
jgi:hypothetical protein